MWFYELTFVWSKFCFDHTTVEQSSLLRVRGLATCPISSYSLKVIVKWTPKKFWSFTNLAPFILKLAFLLIGRLKLLIFWKCISPHLTFFFGYVTMWSRQRPSECNFSFIICLVFAWIYAFIWCGIYEFMFLVS